MIIVWAQWAALVVFAVLLVTLLRDVHSVIPPKPGQASWAALARVPFWGRLWLDMMACIIFLVVTHHM